MNVRAFAAAPVIHGKTATDENARVGEEGDGGSCDRYTPPARSRRGRGGGHGRRKRQRRLWMFHSGEKYEPATATERWGGPGSYDIVSSRSIQVREPGRLSPVFRHGSGRERFTGGGDLIPDGVPSGTTTGISRERGGEISPDRLKAPDELPVAPVVFTPTEPKTIAHYAKTNPVRFAACFVSVGDRFAPAGASATAANPQSPPWIGPGDVNHRGLDACDTRRKIGLRRMEYSEWGPVERYDFVGSREQPPRGSRWLATSIRPGVPYNPALDVDKSTSEARHQTRMSVDPPVALLPSPGVRKAIDANVVDEASGGDSHGLNPEQAPEIADAREQPKATLAPEESFPPSRGARGRISPSIGALNASTVAATVAGLAKPWACSRWEEGILQDAAAGDGLPLENPGGTSHNMGSTDSAKCSGRTTPPDTGRPQDAFAFEAATAPWSTEGETSRVTRTARMARMARTARERSTPSRRPDRHAQDPEMEQTRDQQETRIDKEGARDETGESREIPGRTDAVNLEDCSFIRTPGRRRRGPCMLTLSSEGVRGMGEGIECRKIVWEVEPEGGPVSPGGIRVLVC